MLWRLEVFDSGEGPLLEQVPVASLAGIDADLGFQYLLSPLHPLRLVALDAPGNINIILQLFLLPLHLHLNLRQLAATNSRRVGIGDVREEELAVNRQLEVLEAIVDIWNVLKHLHQLFLIYHWRRVDCDALFVDLRLAGVARLGKGVGRSPLTAQLLQRVLLCLEHLELLPFRNIVWRLADQLELGDVDVHVIAYFFDVLVRVPCSRRGVLPGVLAAARIVFPDVIVGIGAIVFHPAVFNDV